MTITKICKKHGELTSDKVVRDTKGVLICKKCRNSYAEDWREKNKQKQKLKCLELRRLAKENKLKKTCKIHGNLQGKDILINIRASRMCGLCQRKKVLDKYREKKLLKPKSTYQLLREEKLKGNCKIHGENTRTKTGKQACKLCRQKSSERWRQRNPDKVEKMNEQLRFKRNGFEYKEKRIKRLEIRKNEDINGYRKLMAKRAKEYRDKLPDAYIKQQIKSQRVFKKDNIKIPINSIPKELIDLKRIHLQLKQKLKEENK